MSDRERKLSDALRELVEQIRRVDRPGDENDLGHRCPVNFLRGASGCTGKNGLSEAAPSSRSKTGYAKVRGKFSRKAGFPVGKRGCARSVRRHRSEVEGKIAELAACGRSLDPDDKARPFPHLEVVFGEQITTRLNRSLVGIAGDHVRKACNMPFGGQGINSIVRHRLARLAPQPGDCARAN
jgi:hypothetical protein